MNKVVESADLAVADVPDGATILCGGFGCVGGVPSTLWRALAKRPVKDLTLVGNAPVLGVSFQRAAARTMTVPDTYDDASLLLDNGQVRRLVLSVPTIAIYSMPEPFPVVKAIKSKQDLEIELVPQGTLAERIRTAKAGVGAFYTRTGAGTYLARGKETRQIKGEEYVLEYPIEADYAFIRACRADRYGNLVYRGTSRTFNATMAGAARVTVAEVDEVVELGQLDPESVVTPAPYVDRVVVR